MPDVSLEPNLDDLESAQCDGCGGDGLVTDVSSGVSSACADCGGRGVRGGATLATGPRSRRGQTRQSIQISALSDSGDREADPEVDPGDLEEEDGIGWRTDFGSRGVSSEEELLVRDQLERAAHAGGTDASGLALSLLADRALAYVVAERRLRDLDLQVMRGATPGEISHAEASDQFAREELSLLRMLGFGSGRLPELARGSGSLDDASGARREKPGLATDSMNFIRSLLSLHRRGRALRSPSAQLGLDREEVVLPSGGFGRPGGSSSERPR